jgi:hypothetical protein
MPPPILLETVLLILNKALMRGRRKSLRRGRSRRATLFSSVSTLQAFPFILNIGLRV